MSIFISFILVSINFGYSHTFLLTWLKIWSQAFICAFFGAYFFPRIIQKMMNKIIFIEKSRKNEKNLQRNPNNNL